MIYNFTNGMATAKSTVSGGITTVDLSTAGEVYLEWSIEAEGSNFKLIETATKVGSKKRLKDTVLFSLTKADLQVYATFLDKTGFANYKDVKTDTSWQQIYDVASRALPHKEGKVIGTKYTDSVPCVNCGFIFPLENITVDHQRPQSGGACSAALKVFRAMGLTVDAARGFKGLHIFDVVSKGHVLNKSKKIVINNPSGTGLRGQRYELSDEGVLVYSIMRAITSKSILMQACMNNACNLSPLCGICNSSKNNKWLY